MERFKNKYRIQSARAQWWDYGWSGAYFITICTHNREPYFGQIVAGKMDLSKTGVIADILWHQIPNHDPFTELGEFVVMPNHIHGILILNKPDDFAKPENGQDLSGGGIDPEMIGTLHATSLSNQPPPSPQSKNETMASISPKSNTVSTIVRSYKSAVTKHANRLGLPNGWQPRFHDHIIRNDAEYQRISDYIINNPSNWQADKSHKS